MPENCERCEKPIEKDSFCANMQEPFFGKWLCNACVNEETDWWEQECVEETT
jgi:hypothetical protein